jgi:hypothetical protein
MPEGLSPVEVGKEIGEHERREPPDAGPTRSDRVITIVEAVLLALVALAVAWSGYTAARWSTEASVALAQASSARTESSQANLDALETRNFDSSTFDAWFTAYTAGNQTAMTIAERRFRPEFRAAFDAWRATNPDTNPDAPPGPTFMEEYEQPDLDRAARLEDRADNRFQDGSEAGANADDYVRTTVFLATVLFLVGVSGHFPLRVARYGLVSVSIVILAVALARMFTLPDPPA